MWLALIVVGIVLGSIRDRRWSSPFSHMARHHSVSRVGDHVHHSTRQPSL